MRKKTLLIGLCTFFSIVCAFFCTYSTLKVRAITNTETKNIYYQYYDNNIKMTYMITMDTFEPTSFNSKLLNTLQNFSTSSNVRNMLLPMKNIVDKGTYQEISILFPIPILDRNINNFIFNISSYYFVPENVYIRLYELPTGTSAITVQQMIGFYEVSAIPANLSFNDEYYTFSVNMLLDNPYIFDLNRRYMVLIIFNVEELEDTEYIGFDSFYTNMSSSYNEGFQEGQNEGTNIGINEVLTDPNEYNLYTNEEYINYGAEEYQRGVNSGTSAFRSFRDIMATIFSASDSVYSTELFPGITLGLIIGLPLLLTLLIVVLKILRG